MPQIPVFGFRPYKSQGATAECLELLCGVPAHLAHSEDADAQLVQAPVRPRVLRPVEVVNPL